MRRVIQIPHVSTFGLGDAFAAVAQPFAAAMDKALGTHLQDCEGCKRRRKAANRVRVPTFQRRAK